MLSFPKNRLFFHLIWKKVTKNFSVREKCFVVLSPEVTRNETELGYESKTCRIVRELKWTFTTENHLFDLTTHAISAIFSRLFRPRIKWDLKRSPVGLPMTLELDQTLPLQELPVVSYLTESFLTKLRQGFWFRRLTVCRAVPGRALLMSNAFEKSINITSDCPPFCISLAKSSTN